MWRDYSAVTGPDRRPAVMRPGSTLFNDYQGDETRANPTVSGMGIFAI